MDDLDMLARDFGFGSRGKSNPMKSDPADRPRPAARSSIDDPLFNDVFGGPLKYSSSSNSNVNSNNYSSINDFDYDSIFKSSEPKNSNNSSKTSSLPVYDKPVYDEDMFDGLPGLKSKPASSTVRFDGVFPPISSPPSSKSRHPHTGFDDLLGNLGRNEKVEETNKSDNAKSSSSSRDFDDLLAGFGGGSSATSNSPIPESSWGSVPAAGSKHRPSVVGNPFVVLESTSTTGSSSSRIFTDPLEEITKLDKSKSASTAASSGCSGAFDDLDPLNNFGNPVHSFSSERYNGGKDGSPSRSASPQSGTTREQKGNSSFGYSESNMEKKVPVDSFQEPPLFDVPNVSADFQKSFGRTASPPLYNETGSQVDMSHTSEGQGQHDIWLTVSEIPLFTQPTNAPPPSRPPPPIPRQTSRSEAGSFSSSSRKKDNDFFSPSSYTRHSQSPKLAQPAAKGSPVSQFDELEDFAKGLSRNDLDESANLHSSEENNAVSAAAASAAAMKEAMDKAEAKFRHAKEVREREYAKAARNKESVQLEKDEQNGQEREFRETQERLEHERRQKEEEREQRRLERERERSREIEREKVRQAVERATREARERAAVEARDRAAADARLKTERAAVGKANAEARGRAERAAVQRVQAEARERAAAEAKERAGRAAAAEAREKEAADKASVARSEVESRRRVERAAVEKVAAEARERAAAEARDRAAAAAKANQQKNDNDLDSIFGVGRASSAPRARANSTDPLFDQQFQNKGGSEAEKRTPSPSSSGVSSNMKKASSTTNIVDDLSSIFGAAPSSGEFQEVVGETEERRRARLDRHQRTQERAAKAVAVKNQRDIQAQRDQEERHRIADTLDFEIKRWATGKEGNLRALLSTLQYVLWPECGWQPISLTDLIIGAAVKKAYRKATLCIHPDKVQQKGATIQQKYITEKVFDLLKEAWNKFNSEELF